MGAWVKENIPWKQYVSQGGGGPKTYQTSPATVMEAQEADDYIQFFEIDELAGAGASIKVIRFHGPNPETIEDIDSSATPAMTIANSGVYSVAFGKPFGAVAGVKLEIAGSATVTARIRGWGVWRTTG